MDKHEDCCCTQSCKRIHNVPADYVERVYAGWLGKVIGVRYGAPFEMWSDERIERFFGRLSGYVMHHADFAADDDTNGPLFFSRVLDDTGKGAGFSYQDIGEAVLNYVPYEHGFFWWGGYGVSAEHTMYHNLLNGIMPPDSGSEEQNGPIMAGQIGGQIFIDPWGLVAPGDMEKAASMARKAASIAWDGVGIDGGVFIACCISTAFDGGSIEAVIKRALTMIPEDSDYYKVVVDIMDFHNAHPDDWRLCLRYIKEHYWMDKWIGNCHIIPNIAIMILSMLYGGGSFSKSLDICAMCGFDTDCNLGNIACILGVLNGLEGMDLDKWAPEINDFQAASSVLGALNITDVAQTAFRFARLGYEVMGEEVPSWVKLMTTLGRRWCSFELPHSTHAFRVAALDGRSLISAMYNSDEDASSGHRSLAVSLSPMPSGRQAKVYIKTYYAKEDFTNGRYEPVTSPIAYPGQRLEVSLRSKSGEGIRAALYALDGHDGTMMTGPQGKVGTGGWTKLSYSIPPSDSLVKEVGVIIETDDLRKVGGDCCFLLDDFIITGGVDYRIDFSKEHNWGWLDRDVRTELSQFTRLKGTALIEGGRLRLRSSDYAEVYTGDNQWSDYELTQDIEVLSGSWNGILFRVQGAMRSYAAFLGEGWLCLCKKAGGRYLELKSVEVEAGGGRTHQVGIRVQGPRIQISFDGDEAITFEDGEGAYLNGCIGMAMRSGSAACFGNIHVKSIE